VVADVDADGRAEIVAVANNNCGFGTDRGVFVYGDQANSWLPARKIWNQYGYHVTNVNDDGSIPSVEKASWLADGVNTYRAQTHGMSDPFVAPDLEAITLTTNGEFCRPATALTLRVKNGGDNVALAPIQVAFYDGDPASGGTLLGVEPIETSLETGDATSVTLKGVSLSGNHELCAVADDDGTGKGTIDECNEKNNKKCIHVDLGSRTQSHDRDHAWWWHKPHWW
jgi:hypothetical protein